MRALGPKLAAIAAAVDAEVTANPVDVESAMIGHWGYRALKEAACDGRWRYAGAFEVRGIADEVVSLDGRPALVLHSLTAGPAHFYEATVLDLATGLVFQSLNIEVPASAAFFGPASIPTSERVHGMFTADELERLRRALSEATR